MTYTCLCACVILGSMVAVMEVYIICYKKRRLKRLCKVIYKKAAERESTDTDKL